MCLMQLGEYPVVTKSYDHEFLIKDGNDLEGSNVHAYIALNWPIHNARLLQKTYRKQ